MSNLIEGAYVLCFSISVRTFYFSGLNCCDRSCPVGTFPVINYNLILKLAMRFIQYTAGYIIIQK